MKQNCFLSSQKRIVIKYISLTISAIIIRTELEFGRFQTIPMDGLPLKSTWNLIWLKNKKLSPVAEAFLKFIEEKKDEIIKNHFYQIS